MSTSEPRISQVLPTVKCSNCNNPVKLDDLGEHVCPTVPSLPKPSLSPNAAASLLPPRLQNLVISNQKQPLSPISPHRLLNRPEFRADSTPPALIARERAASSSIAQRELYRNPSNATTSSTYTTASTISPSFNPPPVPRPRFDSHPALTPSFAPPPLSPRANEPDTKSGGEAGMAGVGRRGFAAAARAAMFANAAQSPQHVSPSFPPSGLRPNAPQYLDITAAVNSTSRSVSTPPLSPNSGYSSSHSPGPHSPVPSPFSPTAHNPNISLSASSSRTPSPNLFYSSSVPPLKSSTTSALSVHLPFLDKAPASAEPPPMSPSSESDYGGLAYADSEDESAPGSPPPPAPRSILRSPTSPKNAGQVRFPSILDDPVRMAKNSPPPSSASPSSNNRVERASINSRSTVKSTGALERAMETLFEETSSIASPTDRYSKGGLRGLDRSASERPVHSPAIVEKKAQRSNTVPGPGASSTPVTSPQMPKRSLTSPIYATTKDKEEVKIRIRRPKVCVRCEQRIEDGRWIQTDGGGVLCERCWKNMYLPKCRRCNLPIEKQAVSSSDGQLKGKYHRDCFNCHTCHKSFPDKTFYVFDGKPFCAYHYHEANDSLCAAATCGQPIEGPCAVSHAGDRYHPAHLLCEHLGCGERLVEYWEVEGRMLCDRHARGAASEDDHGVEEDADEAENHARRATKRVTRFIDLGEFGASDLR